MNILIADSYAKIPIKKYGGTERVIWGLGKKLVELGHTVTYLVAEGSKCDFARVLVFDESRDINEQIPDDIDVVHLNHQVKYQISKPYLITMHGNPRPEEILDMNMVFLTKNQAKRYNSDVYVYNGLDWDDYDTPSFDVERKYTHFLGKAGWKVKNAFGAIKIAVKAKEEVRILGGDKWNFRNVKRGLKYLLNSKVVFEGMVDNKRKMEVMNASKALIFPVNWHEPFGLAIIESLYAGCAVFGSKNGSLEELIIPSIGASANTAKELTAALVNFEYNPEFCHEYAKKHFCAEVMAKAYEKLYTTLIEGKCLNAEMPKYMEEHNKVVVLN